jgi:hypothetical protein
MKQEILHLDYELNLKDYRKIWVDLFKESLPSLIFFWGIAVVLSLLGLLFTSEKLVFTLTTITFSAIPTYIALSSYQSYMNQAKKAFEQLLDNQKRIHLTFQPNSDGFECISGKSFSHISWESIKDVNENEDYFIFGMAGNFFLIPKISIRNDDQIIFLRKLISSNIGKKAKLLN